MKRAYVYILSNKQFGAIYIGVTRNLARRMIEHREKLVEGFTKRYDITRLVYLERFDDIESAIWREKQLKRWKRRWKIELINKPNPDWDDLYDGSFNLVE
jgi:putative endonuclease